MNKDRRTNLENFDPQELEELEKELHHYLVKYPSEDKIEETISTLRQYVPEKTKSNVFDRLKPLFKHARNEVSLIRKSYWVISLTLFLLGFYVTQYGDYNPLLTLIILSPLPFAFGLLEVFRGRDRGMLEMEMACKFSIYEVMLSRLFVIGIYNITLNTILTLALFPNAEMPLIEMLILWFTPFTLFNAVALSLCIRLRGPIFVPTFLALWVIFCTFILSNSQWAEWVLQVNYAFHFVFIGIGVLLFTLQIKRLIKNFSSFEGGHGIDAAY